MKEEPTDTILSFCFNNVDVGSTLNVCDVKILAGFACVRSGGTGAGTSASANANSSTIPQPKPKPPRKTQQSSLTRATNLRKSSYRAYSRLLIDLEKAETFGAATLDEVTQYVCFRL